MADFHSEDEQPGVTGAAAESAATPSDVGRLDRRSFLRALSGSALTVVAGGLTVTLAACQGASTSSPLISNTTLPATTPPLPAAPSGSANSLGSISTSSPSASSSSSSSGSSGSSSSSGSSTSSASLSPPGVAVRRLAVASLQPQDFRIDGWSTRV